MIVIDYLKPFYTRVSGDTLRIVFAYEYFSIRKDDEIYKFVPTEGKEIIIDMKTNEIKNNHEIFVFQKGNTYTRIPLYQLLLVSNMEDFLNPIINGNKTRGKKLDTAKSIEFDSESLINEIEYSVNIKSIMNAIDIALDNRDEMAFNELCMKLKEVKSLKA